VTLALWPERVRVLEDAQVTVRCPHVQGDRCLRGYHDTVILTVFEGIATDRARDRGEPEYLLSDLLGSSRCAGIDGRIKQRADRPGELVRGVIDAGLQQSVPRTRDGALAAFQTEACKLKPALLN
jgi:hypothetical protein